MSKSVEQRVVQMKFDNREFERNTRSTMKTLERLKNALKLNKTTTGLENLGKATKNLTLDGIASGVDTISSKFSAMSIIGPRNNAV